MSKNDLSLGIGEVAKRSGVAVSALHFYEEKGLISSWRTEGNQRRYAKDVLRRVAIIKVAQKVGVSLVEIKGAFATLPDNRTPTKRDWEKLSKNWRRALQERIMLLRQLEEQLSSCIGCGCLSLKQCPMYNANDIAVARGTGAVFIENTKN